MKETNLTVKTDVKDRIIEIANEKCTVYNYTEGIRDNLIKDLLVLMGRDSDWFTIMSYFVKYGVHFRGNDCFSNAVCIFDDNSDLWVSIEKIA